LLALWQSISNEVAFFSTANEYFSFRVGILKPR